MKRLNRILITVLILFLFVGCGVKEDGRESFINYSDFQNVGRKLSTPWYGNYKVIAHALGGIDGKDYTNSYEALVENYNKGTRVFETDISYTSDGTMVLLHEWSQYHETFGLGEGSGWDRESDEIFLSSLIYDQYHTLTFEELVKIMEHVPDFYVVIDSKTFDAESTTGIYQDLIELVGVNNKKILKRFIPQAYNEETYNAIKEVYEFDDIILTLYSIYAESDGDRIYQLARKYEIKNIVCHMDNDWAKKVIRDVKAYSTYDDWGRENVRIYIHTINDEDTAKSIVEDENFNGIYSDFITEEEYKTILEAE